jgi:hypothetical protein
MRLSSLTADRAIHFCTAKAHRAGLATAGDGADDQQRLSSRRYRLRQWSVHRFVRPILLAHKETEKGTPLLRVVVANRASQHGIARLQGIERATQGDRLIDIQGHRTIHLRQGAQMMRQLHSDHGIVCTSTDRTAGKSCTIGFQ